MEASSSWLLSFLRGHLRSGSTLAAKQFPETGPELAPESTPPAAPGAAERDGQVRVIKADVAVSQDAGSTK
jgi:hypothetical protein